MNHLIDFPFERDRWHRLSVLRSFCDEVARCRELDLKLSSDIRLNRFPWSKTFNEELQPFREFADMRDFPDAAEFKITPHNSPAVDLCFRWRQEFTIQVTVADVAWGAAKHAGKAVRWQYEYLEHNPLAFGGGGTRKINGILNSEPRTVTPEDRINACIRGLQAALVRKLKGVRKADWLLIYARGFSIQLIDDGVDQLWQEVSRICETNSYAYKQVFIFERVEGLHPMLIAYPSNALLYV